MRTNSHARCLKTRAHHNAPYARVPICAVLLNPVTRWGEGRRTCTVREAQRPLSRMQKGSSAIPRAAQRIASAAYVCAALCLAVDRATVIRSRSRLLPLHSSLAVLSRLTAPFSYATATGTRPRHAPDPQALRGRSTTPPLHQCSESPRPCPTLSGWFSCRSLRRASASSATQLARVPPRVPPPPPCGCHPCAHQSQPRPADQAVPGRH